MVRRVFPDKIKKGNKTGPKTKYDPDTTPQLCFNLALLGLMNVEIASVLQIPVKTLELWLQTYPILLKNIRDGKRIADANVAQALYKSATGFSVDDTFIAIYKGKPVIVPIKKYYPPNTGAAIFWLKNKTRDNKFVFSDNFDLKLAKEETIKLDLINTDLSDFSEQELVVLKKLTSKIKIDAGQKEEGAKE